MTLSLQEIYQILLKRYGPQGWWPLVEYAGTNPTLRGRLTGYHPGNYELPDAETQMLEIMLGTILTQNTSWVNAEKALFELYHKGLIDIQKLLDVPLDQLAPIVRSSGYYNQKAARILNLARYLTDHPISSLLRRSIEDLRPELRAIKGMGNETCDSVLLYALKKPIFVVDAYTKRLLIRCGLITLTDSYEEVQTLFHHEIPSSVDVYNEYHALIVQHCVHCCIKAPLCGLCPLTNSCQKKPFSGPKRARSPKKAANSETPSLS
jgi:endonuclease-3 related protein